jgi:lipopolysaccharide export system protein LptA
MSVNLLKSRNLPKIINVFLFAVILSGMGFAQNAGFGSLASDRTEPIEFNSDRLTLNQEKNLAELFGGVKITQGKTVLSAEYVKAIYSETNKLEKVFAERNIELKSNEDIARADKAIYSLTDNSISLTGNAKLVQGANNIMADQILINTETGMTQLLGSVKTIISPSTD